MSKTIYFDYCALFVFGVLLVSLLVRRMIHNRVSRIFASMVIVCFFATVSDILAVQLDMMGSGHVAGKYLFHTLYLFLHCLLPPMYILYIIVGTDTWYKFRKSRLQQLAVFGPIVMMLCMLILNLGWHIVYYLDQNDTYTRGSAFGMLYFWAIYYTIYATVYLLYYRKTVPASRFAAMILMIPVTLIAALVQCLNGNLLVEMFANACGILFMGLMIQRPEERIDSETGLEKLSAYVTDVKRASLLNKPIEIIMINVSNYSTLQDMVGYDGVNELKHRIVNEMRNLDVKYKLNADLYYLNNGKFRFVFSEQFDQVETVAQQMAQFMNQKIQLNRMDVHIISAICITKYPEDISDVDSLLAFGNDLNSKKRSGEVLYASKEYRKEYYDIMKDIDRIIESALAKRRFSVYYQPIYSTKDKRFLSAEALLRLYDEKYGFISPEIIINAAEKSGAIHKIGEYVLEEVCKFISGEDYARLGLEYIEVNLSVVQCMQNNLAAQTLEILKKYNVRPEQINLEITETAASYSQKATMENVTSLKAAGMYFALDDFGTGYSNMVRIASMPFSLVKLDKTFTEDNPRLQIVLKNIIEMIKAMNMQVVIEGVETEEMVERFSQLQCEYIQGYYFSKPLSRDAFVEFLMKNLA